MKAFGSERNSVVTEDCVEAGGAKNDDDEDSVEFPGGLASLPWST